MKLKESKAPPDPACEGSPVEPGSSENFEIAQHVSTMALCLMVRDPDEVEPWIEELQKTGNYEGFAKKMGVPLPPLLASACKDVFESQFLKQKRQSGASSHSPR